MAAQPPPSRGQTIKQAKASYKARGRPSISEADKKKLERAAELDRRAWRIQDSEKRKAEAAKKRAEKERREREELARAQLGSQRRIDRFGYKSSQMHLGAFLRKPAGDAGEDRGKGKENKNLGEDDEFGDGEVDDASLLNTLDGAVDTRTNRVTAQRRSPTMFTTAHALLPLPYATKPTFIPVAAPREENFDDYFDELGSGTQIARELEADQQTSAPCTTTRVPPATAITGRLDMDDFDLTVEDLEELESVPVLQRVVTKQEDKKLMPPPPLPGKKHAPLPQIPRITDHTFTLSQLEQFVDDDLQLTQAAPD